jgi:hypothetical protein
VIAPALRPEPAGPWQAGDLIAVAVTNVVAVGLLLAAAYGVRQTIEPERSVVFLNLAAVGLVVALAGNATFLLSGMRQVAGLRTALLEGYSEAAAAPSAPRSPLSADEAGAPGLVSGPSMTRYHLSDCPAVQGKEVKAESRSAHRKAGRRPCGLCLGEDDE